MGGQGGVLVVLKFCEHQSDYVGGGGGGKGLYDIY